MTSRIALAVEKAVSPAFYRQQLMNVRTATYNYYHPLFRAGSAKPLWHLMFAVSFVMYTTSYAARDFSAIRERRRLEKEALHEYYEKHGGAPGHH